MRPATRSCGAASSSSSEPSSITSASIAPVVPTLPPSAVSTTGCLRGSNSSHDSAPRSHSWAGATSDLTFARPASRSRSFAHATAATSPGVQG